MRSQVFSKQKRPLRPNSPNSRDICRERWTPSRLPKKQRRRWVSKIAYVLDGGGLKQPGGDEFRSCNSREGHEFHSCLKPCNGAALAAEVTSMSITVQIPTALRRHTAGV